MREGIRGETLSQLARFANLLVHDATDTSVHERSHSVNAPMRAANQNGDQLHVKDCNYFYNLFAVNKTCLG